MDRRSFLWHAGGGLGGIALAYLLGKDDLLATPPSPPSKGGDRGVQPDRN